MIKKLTLFKGRTIVFLLLMCLVLLEACRKDRFNLNSDNEQNKQLISESLIESWIDDNSLAKLFTLDWSKARQGKLQGKNVVRIPVLNNDNITGLLNKSEFYGPNQNLTSGKTGSVPRKPGSNTNYDDQQPPEIFFIQSNGDSKFHSYLINFVPENKAITNKDHRNGKLYEWNLTGDTIFVQEVKNNILKLSYCMKLRQDLGIDNSAITLKNKQFQSLNGLKDKKTSNFWKFIANLSNDLLGWIGSLFGLSVYSDFASNGGGAWRLNINWGSVFGGGSNSGNNGTSGYLASGWPIYNAYIPGVYYQGTDIVAEQGGGNPGSPGNPGNPNAVSLDDGFGPYPTSHGPNVSVNTLTADYVIRQLGIGGYLEQSFLRNPNNIEITAALADYVDKISVLDQNDILFGQWALDYVMENPEVIFAELKDNNAANIVLPNLDISELDNYPKFKSLVGDLPQFLLRYPNILKALSLTTGLTETRIKQLMQPGKGPKVRVVNNLRDANGNDVVGQFDDSNKILKIDNGYISDLDNANTPTKYQAIGLILTITTLHEFVHFGRDANNLPKRMAGIITGKGSYEAGWYFEDIITAPGSYRLEPANAQDWLRYYRVKSRQ